MAICEECKEKVSENVENYSKEHFYGKILCVPCQNKVRAGDSEGEGKKEEEEKKGTLDGFGGGATASDEELEKYDNEVVFAELEAESKELDAEIRQLIPQLSMPEKDNFYAWLKSEYGVVVIDELDVEGKRHVLENMKKAIEYKEKTVEPKVVGDEEKSKWHNTVEIDEGTFSFRQVNGKLLCKDNANDLVYELDVGKPYCPCKEKKEWCSHLKAAKVAGFFGESGDKKGKAATQKQIEIEWDKIPVQMLIPKLKKALDTSSLRTQYYHTSTNYCECDNWVREGSSIDPCKHMIRVKYSDEEIRAKLKELGVDDLPMKRKTQKGIAVQEPSKESGMMIRGMTPRLAEVGKIKIGEKSKKMVRGHLPPKKWDHFKIATLLKDDAGRLEMDDNMNEIIGEKCTSLDIVLCYDDLAMNMSSSYAWFAQSKLVCMGNGQTAMRRKEDGSEEEIICNPKECSAYKGKKCNPYGRLSVILTSANRIGGVYVLRTRGWNTIRNVLSSMAFIRKEAGEVLAGLPLRMTLLPMTVAPRDLAYNVKIYAVNIEYPGTLSELKQAGEKEMERRLKLGINMKQTEERYRESVKARMKEEAEEDAKDIAEEFAPEGV